MKDQFYRKQEMVSMTGREYTIVDYVENPLNTPLRMFPAVPTKTPLVVEDGKWVVEVWQMDSRTYRVVGPQPKMTVLQWQSNGERRLLVGIEPFGIIDYFYSNGQPVGGKRFESARQIHNGQLGRYVEIPQLEFAREAKAQPAEHIQNKRDRKRSHVGWARLLDLQKAMGLPLSTILLDYWEFVNFQYDRTIWHPSVEPTIDMVVATREEIHHQLPRKPLRFTRNRVSQLVHEERPDWANYWVRKGFANTLLRLNELGYTPTRAFPIPLLHAAYNQ